MAKWSKHPEFLFEICNVYKNSEEWTIHNKTYEKLGSYTIKVIKVIKNLDFMNLNLYKPIDEPQIFYKNDKIKEKFKKRIGDYIYARYESFMHKNNNHLLILDSEYKNNDAYSKIYCCRLDVGFDNFIDSIRNKKIKNEYDILKEVDAGFKIFENNEYLLLSDLFYCSQLYSLIL